MNSFSIKVGAAEICVQSDDPITPERLEWCADTIERLAHLSPMASEPSIIDPNPGGVAHKAIRREGTINSVISKLGASSAREVQIAAAIHLTLFDGKERFTTSDWDDRAREANAWKATWSKDKAHNRKRLVATGFVVENAKDVYSVSADQLREYEAKLG